MDFSPFVEIGPKSVLQRRDSRSRMKCGMHFFQPRVIDVRVDLRRGDAGVAEHFLDLPQVGPAGQKVRGEAMPERMGA
jgi:hypothetical protein